MRHRCTWSYYRINYLSSLCPESLRSALLESESVSKSERSKSYDEGLESYHEEGRGCVPPGAI